MEKIKTNPIDKIIIGSFIVLGTAEAALLSALFLHKKFSTCAAIMGILFGALILAANLFAIIGQRKKVKSLKKRTSSHLVLGLLISGLIIFQIIWNFYMHEPNIQEDITADTVQTILTSDAIYEVNPFTGRAYSVGMPMRLKILVLPVLYAAVSLWTGISVQTVCYEWMPMLVLILSYLVYTRWAVYLFPDEKKKQYLFMLFVTLVYQFGNYAAVTDSFGLFSMGFTGETIRRAIILPYVLLSCIQKKWYRAILGALAEVCVVWTLYGLGYSAPIIIFVLLVQLLQEKFGNNKKAGRAKDGRTA